MFERKYGGAGGAPRSLHHREPDYGPRSRAEIRHQQVNRTYGCNKKERSMLQLSIDRSYILILAVVRYCAWFSDSNRSLTSRSKSDVIR